ncbi:MAG: hypothetical protein M1838_000324 [Thelocarpon superellum]|nr:MAG: hypothetical protein M1838_000324 [Thelocarpon superellum]
MPSSPPKRMTRARARAVGGVASPPKTTKITTAAAKATRTTTKRKTPADETDIDEVMLPAPTVTQDVQEPTKRTRGRPKKVLAPTEVSTQDPPAGEKPLDPPVQKTTRGRAKKTTAATTTTTTASVPATRSETRTISRVPAQKAATSTATATTTATSTTITRKKKVTFEDEQLDKENRVPSPIAKGAAKTTGIRAKPVRKPVTTRVTRRGKKAADEDEAPAPAESVPKPLSPKKATQVATASTGSDDELCGQKTPVKTLRSPAKKPAVARPKEASTTEPTASEQTEPTPLIDRSSPTKSLTSSILASPARRPPPSPFKNALKDSPRKFHLPDTTAAQLSVEVSPSFESAAKGSVSPFKVSLLDSPARRPPSSVLKSLVMRHPQPRVETAPESPIRSRPPPFTLTPFKPRAKSPLKICPPPAFEAAASKTEVVVNDSPPRMTLNLTTQIEHDVIVDACGPELEAETTTTTPGKMSALEIAADSSPVIPDEDPSIVAPPTTSPAVATEKVQPSAQSSQASTPSADPVIGSAFKDFMSQSPATQYPSDESDSEDELHSAVPDYTPAPARYEKWPFQRPVSASTPSNHPSPRAVPSALRRQAAQGNLFDRVTLDPESSTIEQAQVVTMTPLVNQLQTWRASSPEKLSVPLKENLADSLVVDYTLQTASPKSTFFEDEMSVRDVNELQEDDSVIVHQTANDAISNAPTALSEASQEYGDENVFPIDPALLEVAHRGELPMATCTPARVFSQGARIIHTVSKVPLRAAAEESPCRPALKRSISSGALSGRGGVQSEGLSRSKTVVTLSPQTPMSRKKRPAPVDVDLTVSPIRSFSTPVMTPKSVGWSTMGTPSQTSRRLIDPLTLKGAVVYVDVHTTEGADASSLFVELLTQMGARCVKQWTWNPDTSPVKPSDQSSNGLLGDGDAIREVAQVQTPGGSAVNMGKIGITHVVYKDGGKRTLEKVRESNGVVLCVGVGWVLDCEREGKWLDETTYAIDISLVPRGGSRRRKSMEPRALSNINGHLQPSGLSPSKDGVPVLSPTKEFLTFSSPARRDSTLFTRQVAAPETPRGQSEQDAPTCRTPSTMAAYADADADANEEMTLLSPTTPYYLHASKIVQQTCPPKPSQAQQGSLFPVPLVFPVTGRIEDQSDDRVRARLLLARRKSLQFAPKVASPLSRDV